MSIQGQGACKLVFYNLDIIAYPTTSHGIWRFIPHRGDYIPRSEAGGITSVQWGDSFSTVEGIQYIGGITSVHAGG